MQILCFLHKEKKIERFFIPVSIFLRNFAPEKSLLFIFLLFYAKKNSYSDGIAVNAFANCNGTNYDF